MVYTWCHRVTMQGLVLDVSFYDCGCLQTSERLGVGVVCKATKGVTHCTVSIEAQSPKLRLLACFNYRQKHGCLPPWNHIPISLIKGFHAQNNMKFASES